MEQTFFGLLRHAWGLIRTWKFSEWRISRGEYRIGILLLSTAMALLWLVFRWISLAVFYLPESAATNALFSVLTIIASVIIPIIVTVFQIKLIVKRSHDLGKNGRYAYIPMLVIAWCLMVWLWVLAKTWFFTASGAEQIASLLADMKSNVLLWIIWFIGIIAFLWSLARWIVIGFYKGNTGDNEYGSDPLLHQISSDGLYRWVWIVLLVINIIIGMMSTAMQHVMFEDDTMWGGDGVYMNNDSDASSDIDAEELVWATWEIIE